MVDYPTVPIITEHGIDLNELLDQIALPLDGAVAMFARTVFIVCAAPHRDPGVFETGRYGTDRLKQIVPIWKKEIGPNGAAWVEGEDHTAVLETVPNSSPQ